MKIWLVPIVVAILVIVTLLWVILVVGPAIDELEDQSCEYLLNYIQADGMKPNYQYAVKAWIAQECWK